MSNRMFKAVVADATNDNVAKSTPSVGNAQQIENSIKMESAKSEVKKYSLSAFADSVVKSFYARAGRLNENYVDVCALATLYNTYYKTGAKYLPLDFVRENYMVSGCLSVPRLSRPSIIAIKKELETLVDSYANIPCQGGVKNTDGLSFLGNRSILFTIGRAYVRALQELSGVVSESAVKGLLMACLRDAKKRAPKLTKKQSAEKAVYNLRREMIASMLADNLPIEVIAKYTGVPAEYVLVIARDLK